MYLSKVTDHLLEVFTVFLHCCHIHRQNQDISLCEILSYFWNIAKFSKIQTSNTNSLTHTSLFFRAPKICYIKWLTNPPRHFCLTLSSSCSLRADRTSFTPAHASARAKCSPIPLEAPVIHTTLPARESVNIKYFTAKHEEIHSAWDMIRICIQTKCSGKLL
jgi:hypothetical protein